VPFDDSVFVAWTTQDVDDVRAIWAWAAEGGVQVSEPIDLPDHLIEPQRQPAATAVGDGQVLVAWADGNREYRDNDGTGIRGRWVGSDGSRDEEQQLNAATQGDQVRPSLAAGEGYAVSTWIDAGSGLLRGRYIDGRGRPLLLPFQPGTTRDFVLARSGVAGRAALAAAHDHAYFVWLEGSCGEDGGSRLVLRALPAPAH
jgi:hypothetical protein